MSSYVPLAISQSLSLRPTSLRCIGIFGKAINLLTTDDRLLVLQRYGHGLSPMGMLIRGTDFNAIAQALGRDDTLRLCSSGLHHRRFSIGVTARRISLTMPPLTLLPHCLDRLLAGQSHATGLFGPLEQAIKQPLSPWLHDLRQHLFHWLTGHPCDFTPFIGLGPGLTPSSDDMLIGVMALLHSDRRSRSRMQQFSLLPPSCTLRRLTASVSRSYLQHAAAGRFSSTLLRLLQRLAQGRGSHSQIGHFLTLGHYSGADTLLGLAMANHWLGDFYQGSDAYA
ncbi:TPA: DUF2877 domain-containing protein [Serratia odorifera]|nr:DUF2877 domain-containing protein [Serratia odorifera]